MHISKFSSVPRSKTRHCKRKKNTDYHNCIVREVCTLQSAFQLPGDETSLHALKGVMTEPMEHSSIATEFMME